MNNEIHSYKSHKKIKQKWLKNLKSIYLNKIRNKKCEINEPLNLVVNVHI